MAVDPTLLPEDDQQAIAPDTSVMAQRLAASGPTERPGPPEGHFLLETPEDRRRREAAGQVPWRGTQYTPAQIARLPSHIELVGEEYAAIPTWYTWASTTAKPWR